MCVLLHQYNLRILAKNRFEKSATFVKIQQGFTNTEKKFLQNYAKRLQILKFQLNINLEYFETCCKTRIYLQK